MNKLKISLFVLLFLSGCSVEKKTRDNLNKHAQTLNKLEQIQEQIEKDLLLPNTELLERNVVIKDQGMMTSDCVVGVASYLYQKEVLSGTSEINFLDTTLYYLAVKDVFESLRTITENSSSWQINDVHDGYVEYEITSLYVDFLQDQDHVTVFISTNLEDAQSSDAFPNLDYWASPIYEGKINYVVKAIYFYPSKNACK